MGIGGLGIGDLGIGDWGLGPIPNPQSPIPNPQSPIPIFFKKINKLILIYYNYYYYLYKKILNFKNEYSKTKSNEVKNYQIIIS